VSYLPITPTDLPAHLAERVTVEGSAPAADAQHGAAGTFVLRLYNNGRNAPRVKYEHAVLAALAALPPLSFATPRFLPSCAPADAGATYAALADGGHACCAALIAGGVRAQEVFPSRPIRMIIPFPAGGPTDVYARLYAERLGRELGQPVVTENRGGAGGAIGSLEVSRARADGYTILVNTLSLNVNAILGQGRVKYDPTKDFAPISLAVALPQYLVVGYDSPYKTLADLVAKAKLTGTSGFCVADVATGQILDSFQPSAPVPPACGGQPQAASLAHSCRCREGAAHRGQSCGHGG
jgi:hypothetical protein